MNRQKNLQSGLVFLLVIGLTMIACQSVTGIIEEVGMGGGPDTGSDSGGPSGEDIDISSMYALLRTYAANRGWPADIAAECDSGGAMLHKEGEPCFYPMQNEFRDGYGLGISYYFKDQEANSLCYKSSSAEVYYTREPMDLTHLLNESFTSFEYLGTTVYIWDSTVPGLTSLYHRWMTGPVYFQTVESSYGDGCENQLQTSQPYVLMFDLVGQGYLNQ